MKQKRGLSLLQKRNAKGFMFILPWLIGFIIFYVRSMFMTAQFSLFNNDNLCRRRLHT